MLKIKSILPEDIRLHIPRALFIPSASIKCFKNSDWTKGREINKYEMVLFTKPGGFFLVNGKRYDIAGHDIRLYKPGDIVRSYRFHDVYVIHFKVGKGFSQSEQLNKLPSYMPIVNYEELRTLMENLISANSDGNIFLRNYYFWTIIHALIENQRLCKEADHNTATFIVKCTQQYIEQNYSKPIRLADIGRALYLHPNYVHHVFSKEMGITPTKYLLQVRLSAARQFLLTRDMSIAEIAEACGFCNSSYFIKQFQLVHTVSPGEYRKKMTTITEELV